MDTQDLYLEVELEVPSQTRYLGLIGRVGEDLVYELDYYQGDLARLAHQVNLVLTEAASNAMEHGNNLDPSKVVRVCIAISGEELCIRVYDQGLGFDLNGIPPPDSKPLEERGRGIFIIRSLMDWVTYVKANDGHVLEMGKRLK
jgi:serine/threonine-protein kinase RsbW